MLAKRRSQREFADASLDLTFLGALLYWSYGVLGTRDVDGETIHHRPAPSAGGLYPLELYPVTRAIEGLNDGSYHYDARAAELELRHEAALNAQLAALTIGQDAIQNANAIIVISAWLERTTWKYGPRGYRYVLLDAGHMAQNLYLVATALGLSVVSIGGFYDDGVARLLELPADEKPIYLVCIGQATTRADPAG